MLRLSEEDSLIVLMSGVPVNIPCLTGASVRGTTVPPCSAAHRQCPEVGTRCAVLYDEAGCEGWSRDVRPGEETRLRWWDLSVFKYRSVLIFVSP